MNAAPVLSFDSPEPGTEFLAGQAIPITVVADDPDGEVVSVRILVDDTLLAELTSPPFTTLWSGGTPGNHVLSATATDDNGATSISSNVVISVAAPETGDFAVDAGVDQIIEVSQAAFLLGVLDVQPSVAGGDTNLSWLKASGPGNVQFSNPDSLSTTAQFSEPGSYTLRLRAVCAGGTRSDTLSVTVLDTPPRRLTGARTSKGTDFWFAFLWQTPAGFEDPGYQHVVITAESDADVVMTHPAFNPDGSRDGWDVVQEERFHLSAGSTRTVSYMAPDTWNDGPFSDVIRSNAVHVTASSPVTVHGLNRVVYSTDGFLALPTSLLSTNYLVLSYSNGGAQFAVVATEDETKVSVTPNLATGERPAGVPYTIVLQRGEVYRLANVDGDLTGSSVISDKPVAVISGTASSWVPPEYGFGDHLVEQLVPVAFWGRHFATLPLAPRTMATPSGSWPPRTTPKWR